MPFWNCEILSVRGPQLRTVFVRRVDYCPAAWILAQAYRSVHLHWNLETMPVPRGCEGRKISVTDTPRGVYRIKM